MQIWQNCGHMFRRTSWVGTGASSHLPKSRPFYLPSCLKHGSSFVGKSVNWVVNSAALLTLLKDDPLTYPATQGVCFSCHYLTMLRLVPIAHLLVAPDFMICFNIEINASSHSGGALFQEDYHGIDGAVLAVCYCWAQDQGSDHG